MRTVNCTLEDTSVTYSATAASTRTAKLDQIKLVDVTAVIAGSSPNGSIKLQKNNNPPEVTAVWVDLDDTEVYNGANSRTITTAATFNWLLDNFSARELRAYITRSSGTITADIRVHGKE